MERLPLKKALAAWLAIAFSEADASPSEAEFEASFEVPKEEKFGDISTNIAFRMAKALKVAPRALADGTVKILNASLLKSPLAGRVAKITVEGPGFINFYLTDDEIRSALSAIRQKKADFGRPGVQKKKVLLEFVSANPTGPLTVAHGRQAALGDSLARILRFCGHDVTTEYYNNDEGVQINTLAASLEHRVKELREGKETPLPENYYQGGYLIDIAKDFVKEGQKDDKFRTYARDRIMAGIKQDLQDFDVTFDNYYSQEALGKSGKVEKTLEELRKKGKVFESEGAVWLRSTEYGDDKDRVLIKSDKTYTYLTPDIAYHHEKFVRGFEKIIDILGPDHHGYIARLKASQAALGHDPNAIHVLIAQLVTLFQGQQEVRMSTRAGQFVTLREILDEVGKDAGRFFFVARKFDAHLDFDLQLAKTQTPDNPVFYIQYAHARIESIKGQFRGKSPAFDEKALGALTDVTELRLLRLLSQFEDAVLGAEKTLEPYRLVPYLMELAAAFHRFYTEKRVVTEDLQATQARFMLCEGVQHVLKTGLNLLGVSAPLKM